MKIRKATGLLLILLPFLIVLVQMIKPVRLWESLLLQGMLAVGCNAFIKE